MQPELTTLTITLAPWMIRAGIVAIPVILWVMIFRALCANNRRKEQKWQEPWQWHAFLAVPFTMILVMILIGVYFVGLWIING